MTAIMLGIVLYRECAALLFYEMSANLIAHHFTVNEQTVEVKNYCFCHKITPENA